MDEVELLKKTLYKQSQRIAALSLDLDLAHTQIDILNEQLKEKEQPKAE